jgi:fumarylacetoacetate (FAA) hydrolase family protein
MTDEDESTNPGIIVAAERAILKFLRDREANEATPEDRGKSTVNQVAEHPVSANPVKQKKTVEELAAMIHQDLSQIEGCPKQGVKVTIYGLNPWNCLLTFGVDAGPVRNRAELQGFCDIITERLKRLYDVRDPHVEGSANGK